MTALDDSTLVAFADGELDPTTMRLVADLVARDPTAQEKVRQLREAAQLVRAALAEPAWQAVPEGLAERVLEPRWQGRRVHLGWAVAASLALCGVGFGGGVLFRGGEEGAGDQLVDEVADYHVAYARFGAALDEAPASQSARIGAWFARVLRGPFHVPDMSSAGLTFRGARLLVADGRPVAQLLYDPHGVGARPLGLCFSEGEPRKPGLRIFHRQGVTLAEWGQRGYTVILVGWASASDLTALAARVRPMIAAL